MHNITTRLFKPAYHLVCYLFLLSTFNCVNTPNDHIQNTPEVDSLLQVFTNEASKRGVDVNVVDGRVRVIFGDLGSRSGSCKPNESPKTITLDSLLWRMIPPRVKEMLLFHELAHCVLDLGHNNSVLPTGECSSWMRAEQSTCKVNFVNKVWRDYYLDQLFSKGKTIQPSWYDASRHPDQSVRLIKSEFIPKGSSQLVDTTEFHQPDKWKIVASLADTSSFKTSQTIHEYALRVNEYWFHFVFNSSPLQPRMMVSETIFLTQYKTLDNNRIWNKVIPAAEACHSVTIERDKSVIFVFYDDILKVCIPISKNQPAISIYSTCNTDSNRIDYYESLDLQ